MFTAEAWGTPGEPPPGSADEVDVTATIGEFRSRSCAGRHVLLKAPAHEFGAALDHYLDCKAQRPAETSAVILAPRHLVDGRITGSGMRCLMELSRGERLLTAVGRDGVRIPRPLAVNLAVYYDPPAADRVAVCSGSTPSMLYRGKLQGYPCRVLLDTGAGDNYISSGWVQRAGLRPRALAIPGTVRLADGSEVAVAARSPAGSASARTRAS